MGASIALRLRITPTLAGVLAHWSSGWSEGWIAAPDETAVFKTLRERFPPLEVSLCFE